LELGNHFGPDGPGVQLDRGTLGVETKAGLALLVGADTVVGNKGAAWGYDETELPGKTVIPKLAW
jgi:hypothetical protein